MGSETVLKLPSIDFSNLDQNTNKEKWDLAKSQVLESLVEYGAFTATFANISTELRTSMIDSIQQFHDLPLETKLKTQTVETFGGYCGEHPNMPLYQTMGILHPQIHEKIDRLTQVLWPEGNRDFSNPIQQYCEKLSILDETVRKMVLQSLGVEKYMDEHLSSTVYHVALIKYKAPETDETKVGVLSHRDKAILTILHQNEVAGLEVQSKSGDWIKIQPSPNSYIVLIGGSFHAWTNGRLYTPYHQVMMSGYKDRYSVALYSAPKAGYMVQAPTELVDEEHPLLFKPFDMAKFLEFSYSQVIKQQDGDLKAYCGV